jgi:hypothetical protein
VVTYAGSTGDIVSYADASAGATSFASITPSAMYLRAAISREVLARSENLQEGAFALATKHVVENLLNSMFNKFETQCFYGGVGIAVLSSVAGNVLTINTADFAPGIWVGAEGMKLEAFTAATGGSQRTGTMVVTAVDLIARTITVDSAAASIAANDFLFEKGARGKEFVGLQSMIAATSGTVFGIDVAAYSLWKGNVYSAGSAALSFAKLSDSVAAAVAKGVAGTLTAFVNPKTWSNLLTEQTAKRIFHEGGMSEYDNGAKNIKFYSQNGDIDIISSAFVKEGIAFVLDMESFLKVGSTDVTLDDPVRPGQYLQPLQDSNAIQMIAYVDCSLFCAALGRNILITGIVNS